MNARKKFGLIVIIIISAGILSGTIGYLYADSMHSKAEISELQEMAYSSEVTSKEISIEESADESSTSEVSERVAVEPFVDITALQDTNPDILAWINIPGTGIDYPIAQHPTDDEYYLKHGADGIYSQYGCPFIEQCDYNPFLEFNTVVYGHNMKNGSMFAGLHDYEDKEFFDSHRDINVCTAEHNFSYTVFAAVMYSDARIPYYFDDYVLSDRTAFIESLSEDIVPERSIIDEDIEVDASDYIITLSTCDKNLRDKRFLVVAVLKQIDGQDV